MSFLFVVLFSNMSKSKAAIEIKNILILPEVAAAQVTAGTHGSAFQHFKGAI